MKERQMMVAVMIMFLVSPAGLAGCTSTGSHKMMGDSKAASTGTMDTGGMHEPIHDSTGAMEKDGMQEPMSDSMESMEKDATDKDDMKSDSSGAMK